MLKYVSIDKNLCIGSTPDDVVRSMRAESFGDQRLPLDAFMRRAAATASAWAKQPIRTDTAENFLADMVAAGVLWKDDGTRQPAQGQEDTEQV